MSKMFVLSGINPEPWTSGTVSTGRRGNKIFGRIVKDAGLVAYQRAVQEQLRQHYPDWVPVEGPVMLEFSVFRDLPRYEREGRFVNKHRADATNMQKALEDALQRDKRTQFPGLFLNDTQVVQVTTRVCEQDPGVEPLLVILLTEMTLTKVFNFDLVGKAIRAAAGAELDQRPKATFLAPHPRDVGDVF